MRPASVEQLEFLRRWSRLLDSAFRVPGTRFRFGWDPIIGVIPGLGDLTTPVFGALMILQGARMRVPKVVLARMVINVGIDALTGVVPVLGDVVDATWKANNRNLALLERYATPGVPARRGDWIFVGAALAILALIAVVPFLLLGMLIAYFGWF